MTVPFHAQETLLGVCQYTDHLGDCACPVILLPCPVTEVVEIAVNQNGQGREVLGTMCREHAQVWSTNHIEVKP